MEKLITIIIFVTCYFFAITRKVKIFYPAVISAFLLIVLRIVPLKVALTKSIKWNVLGIYWGFMMLSIVFLESGLPVLLANKILKKVHKEVYVIFSLSLFTAFISAFLENVGVVLIMAPLAMELAKRFKSSIFPYLVSIGISSNVSTTITMIGDPPSIILAMESGMNFLDFYWFQGKLSIGVITIFGVISALLSLLFTFRYMKKRVEHEETKVSPRLGALIIFIVGVIGLVIGPRFQISPGIIGLLVGLVSLLYGENTAKMLIEFDWNSFFFIVFIFIVISSLEVTGLLSDLARFMANSGPKNPATILGIIIWISVLVSSFMDNVPYTVLMIPVCNHLASLTGINQFALLFGMLIGTGIGGNITPVGAAANIFACGIIEKHEGKVNVLKYLKISLPFSIIAVLVSHIFLYLIWM